MGGKVGQHITQQLFGVGTCKQGRKRADDQSLRAAAFDGKTDLFEKGMMVFSKVRLSFTDRHGLRYQHRL